MPLARLAPTLAALLLLCASARSQDATVQGTCERLVIADQDVTATCKGSLLRLVSTTFASLGFSATDGRTLSFTGGGIRETDGTGDLPVTLVAPGLISKDGISRSPTPAAGGCRISHPDPESTLFACEASALGKRYAGRFLARPKADAGAVKP